MRLGGFVQLRLRAGSATARVPRSAPASLRPRRTPARGDEVRAGEQGYDRWGGGARTRTYLNVLLGPRSSVRALGRRSIGTFLCGSRAPAGADRARLWQSGGGAHTAGGTATASTPGARRDHDWPVMLDAIGGSRPLPLPVSGLGPGSARSDPEMRPVRVRTCGGVTARAGCARVTPARARESGRYGGTLRRRPALRTYTAPGIAVRNAPVGTPRVRMEPPNGCNLHDHDQEVALVVAAGVAPDRAVGPSPGRSMCVGGG